MNSFPKEISYSVGNHFPLFFIASKLTGYPNPTNLLEAKETLDELNLQEEASTICEDSWKTIHDFLYTCDTQAIESLSSDYRKLFKIEKELASVPGYHRESEMQLNQPEMSDQISTELAFYFNLLLKQTYFLNVTDEEGTNIVGNTRKDFLLSLLGRYSESIHRRQSVREHKFYRPVFSWITKLIKKECSLLGIEPQTMEWAEDNENTKTSCCGKKQNTAT